MRLSDEDAAYCAAAYFNGTSQKDIAKLYGLKAGSSISTAIANFTSWYHPRSSAPRQYPMRFAVGFCGRALRGYGGDTRPLIRESIAEFVRLRAAALG